MNVAELAFVRLFPERKVPKISVEYGKLHGFNARVFLSFSRLKVQLSRRWKDVSVDIQVGCIQGLLLKVYKIKNKRLTLEMELYNNFIRSLADHVPQTRSHPALEAAFYRVNNKFFSDELDPPNLKIGKGVNLLGSYCYQTNTITISRILLDYPDLLDYVMFHEMLHKKLKFYSTKSGRSMHHSRTFRKFEKSYPNAKVLERRLQSLINQTKINSRKSKGFFSRVFGSK
ncbi:hypothetical protein DRJ25_02790 [Candidatus Woesearchaeota archaeon]|nr:MAG: hypothetical protein DRJ25_02790 [Candidatus Woesearchaeota archaeon]